jgi:RimJ/RimL family protein N-acetyltransferase
VIRWADRAGYRAMSLHATEGNARAERAYQRHGFRRTGRTFLRERDGFTEFEMARELRPDERAVR